MNEAWKRKKEQKEWYTCSAWQSFWGTGTETAAFPCTKEGKKEMTEWLFAHGDDYWVVKFQKVRKM